MGGRSLKQRMLGQTGISVSEISLGCSGFWGSRKFPDKKAISVVHSAFDHGINFFDTGHNYSNYNAEPRLGRALKEILQREDRSKIVISTKAGTLRRRRPRLPFESRGHTSFDPDYIEAACAKSIKNLGCDYIDVFQLHGIQSEQITDELLTRLASMKRRGMVRSLGVNTHREADMRFVAQRRDVFDVVLIDVNILQLDRMPLVADLNRAGLAVLAGTVLAQGHLISGKIGRLRRLADAWYLARALGKREGRLLAKAAGPMRDALSSIKEMTAAQAAMAYVLSVPAVTSCVFGTTDVRNLSEVVAASRLELSEASKSLIQSTFDRQPVLISR